MGISCAAIKLLIREGNRKAFSGSVLTIGRQDVTITNKGLQRLAAKMHFRLKLINTSFTFNKTRTAHTYITDTDLFLSLGFNTVHSLDCDVFEKCTIVHDLNKDIPKRIYQKYDLVFDGGSSEHIFNLPKVLKNYYNLLKIGGRIIHLLPVSNFVDHGFYMFSPTLFSDYYSANKWNIIDSLLIRFHPDSLIRQYEIYKYTPGCLDHYFAGRLDNCKYLLFFIAQKKAQSTFNASVQQRYYVNAWNSAHNQVILPASAKKQNCLGKRLICICPHNLQLILRCLYSWIYPWLLPKILFYCYLKRIA